MKIDLVSRHNPRPEGTPTGRCFFALGAGLVALGHDVEAVCWAPEQPRDELPDWCRWLPLAGEAPWRTRGRALVRPRWDVRRTGWQPRPDSIAVAEDPVSYAAVAGGSRRAVVFHYLTKFDAPAVGRRFTPKDVQDLRHERWAGGHASVPLAFSERVAGGVGQRTRTVPIAYPVPDEPLPTTTEPVVVLLANWAWPPNEPALRFLLSIWPEVRARVPGARLRLAGWGLEQMSIGVIDGVDQIGAVASAADALAGAAVLAFPCPPTSGPKVKVLESLAHGVPVVTTAAGAEGLVLGPDDGAVVTDRTRFGATLAALLADEARRAHLGASGRAAVVRHHAPLPAASARVAALEDAFGGS